MQTDINIPAIFLWQLFKQSPIHTSPEKLNLKTEVSFWKRFKQFSADITSEKFQNTKESAIFDLCLEKTRPGKSRDYREVFAYEKLCFHYIFRPN